MEVALPCVVEPPLKEPQPQQQQQPQQHEQFEEMRQQQEEQQEQQECQHEGNPAPKATHVAIGKLHAQIDRLVTQHRAELCGAFDEWLRQNQHTVVFTKLEGTDQHTPSWQATTNSNIGLDELVKSKGVASAFSMPPLPNEDDIVRECVDLKPKRSPSGAWAFPAEVEFGTRESHRACSLLDSEESCSNVLREPQRSKIPDRFEHRKWLRNGRQQVRSFLTQTKRLEVMNEQTLLQRIVAHRYFELMSVFIILSNAAFIGYQTQYLALRSIDLAERGQAQEYSDPAGFLVMQGLFAFAFLVELMLRWSADGVVGFFLTPDVCWNLFDIIVVCLSLADLAFLLANEQNILSNTSTFRVVRVVRIVRVARVIRVARFFRELRMMLFALLGCMKSLVWALAILMVVFFIFSISITNGSRELLLMQEHMWLDPKYQLLSLKFGTLDRAGLTLYMAMSGGNNWGDIYDLLEVLPIQHRAAFLLFISFAIFAVVNIVTAIFVDSAVQCNQRDRDIIVQEELESKMKYLEDMKTVFEEMDDDHKGLIKMNKFEEKLEDDHMVAYFQALELDVSEAKKLFMLLDFDHSGEISVEEFLSGCHKLKGESRALDMAIMQYEVSWIAEVVAQLQGSANHKLEHTGNDLD